MRVERHCVIDADRDTVWKAVSDPNCYPEFMASLERWEHMTDGAAGKGARYTVHWKVGSVPIGGVVEVSEFDPAHDLAWIGVSGVSQRGRFRIRDNGNGHTKVIFRMSYESAGNLLGIIADRVAARQVGRNMAETLKNLKRMVEP